ncbi:hypothetical protein [Dyella nitratireducens]|uniref:Uncharacterized protein n=1 Tax=Dyella nitratireducens TaxID=1849580 RepID=A0ABQ1GAS4_9GAMM|nr:hypothetical protein [Dyella nitratireducens]GGA40065.1 hypothetical protein GCM10010981_31670 [Dyella nitratireducens]GLQ40525.1 hypothetical protein GCM10007902_03740 [Dyella nitratireducens]
MPIDPEIIPAGKFIPIGIILSNAIFIGREWRIEMTQSLLSYASRMAATQGQRGVLGI